MQLDKVAQAVSRETFGPLYLVTWFSRWVIRDLALWCLWWSCCQVALPFSELKEDSELLWSCDILFHRFSFFFFERGFGDLVFRTRHFRTFGTTQALLSQNKKSL
jgi:hypothetical protein